MDNKNSLYTKVLMGKYRKVALQVMTHKLQTTNKIRKLMEKKTGKAINWHFLFKVLDRLEEEGKIEKVEANRLFLWKLGEMKKKQ